MPDLTETLTRRAALMLAAASPALAQQPKGRPVVHFEIGCRDRGKTRDFYSKLFGWQISASPAGTIDTGSQQGIQGHITSLGHEPHRYTTFYVDVEDVQASLDQAIAMGGTKLVGPVKIPTGTFAWFADPDGNLIAIIKH
jgi:predicted enzyme related to lactoylglutathione lyase